MFNNRVLVVDDEPDIRSVTSKLLQSQGYSVVTAADGTEALAAIKSQSPDLMILDLMMPKMDGLQVLQTLETDQRTQYRKIPTIILGPVREGSCRRCYQLERGLQLGAEDYLEKPIIPEALIDVVGKAFRRHY